MSNKKTTLYSLHSQKLDEISKEEKSIPLIQKQIQELKDKISTLQSSPSILEQLDQLKTWTSELYELEKRLNIIPDSMSQYFLNNGELLYNYSKQDIQTKIPQKYDISNLMVKKSATDNQKSQKNQYFNKYRANVDPTYVHVMDQKINSDNYCYDCDQFRILVPTESKMICEECGQETTVIIGPDKLSMKDPPAETRCYEYKRFGHFCDWLANLQGKESSEVPEEIINTVICEIKRERLENKLHLVDEETIKRYLKKHAKRKTGNIRYDKYYDHSVQILHKITKVPPMSMTSEMEQNLKFMFLKIQEPFERHRDDRSNFISYSYIIYKFCQLLSDDDPEYKAFAKKLKLCKSHEKLQDDDHTWKQICRDLGGAKAGWKFIQSN